MAYRPDERIELVHTDDPYTTLRPGDQGTVVRHDDMLATVYITWDNGSTLSMCLDAGDRIRPVTAEPASTAIAPGDPESGTAAGGWDTVLSALTTAGHAAGVNAAAWWVQDALGDRASGDVRATARRVLAGIDDGDPMVLDSLPALDLSGQHADTPNDADVYRQAAPDHAPDWRALDAAHRDEAIEAYHSAHDTAVIDAVAAHCRTALDTDDA
jgi:hypothetical protein